MKQKIIFILLLFLLSFGIINGQTEKELRDKIKTSNEAILKIQEEITKYENELSSLGSQKQTLNTEISRLNTTQQKLMADIKLTEEMINNISLKIEDIEGNIADEEDKIDMSKRAISETIRKIKYNELGANILEVVLTYNSFSEYVEDSIKLDKLLEGLNDYLESIEQSKDFLEREKITRIEKRNKLLEAETQLKEQNQIVNQNKREKDQLLSQTRNQESAFQNLLVERKRMQEMIEAEIRQAEEELRILIDPDSFPRPGNEIFSWPLDNIRITQGFGLTSFAQRNTGLYGASGHNGIDLAAPIGTPIKAPAGGRVIGVGDTDLTCRGASYGKWLVIDHQNGLSTMYAHLSLTRIQESEIVKRGDVVAWTGNTGYSTGPHLHFSVVVTEGLKIGSLQSQVSGCGIYRLPLGAPNAFLDPIDYLVKR